MIHDERFERWMESRRQAYAVQREAFRRYSYARLLRGDRATAVTLADPIIAAAATTAASTSIQVLPGGVSELFAGSGTNASPRVGYWKEGLTRELDLFGIGTTSTTPGNITWQWNVATSQNVTTGNAISTSAALALAASQSNITWHFHGVVTCVSTGTGGTLLGYFYVAMGALLSTNVVALAPASGARTTATVDTTSASAINVLVTLGATTVSLTTEAAYWKTFN